MGENKWFFIGAHCDSKKSWKILAFSEKSEANLSLTYKRAIEGTFLVIHKSIYHGPICFGAN